MKAVFAYLQLMRPANIVTAMADILAGASIGFITYISDRTYDAIEWSDLILLLLSTIGLYGGGVVMNDVADQKLDAAERPERPLPSGRASATRAMTLGASLFLLGIFSASRVSMQSGSIALVITVLALLYDYFGKHNKLFGPLNMGACRGFNLLLGMSTSLEVLQKYYWLALIPVIFIAAITIISRGEVLGGNRTAIKFAALLFSVVIALIVFIPFHYHFHEGSLAFTVGFAVLFSISVFIPLIKAHTDPHPGNIRKAVKAGVLSLIVMDAAIASAFGGWPAGLIILALLPVSLFLARIFAVT